MINVFYCYGLVWLMVLFSSFLGWSNLCTNLDIGLLIFLILTIIISFFVGYKLRNKLKFTKLYNNPHKKWYITLSIVCFFILEFILEWKIPLFGVLAGKDYAQAGIEGISVLHIVVTSLSIIYCFYLSYIFFCFKEKKVLFEIAIIIICFILLMQRQNVLVCIVGFLNMWFASRKINGSERIKKTLIVIILGLVILYGFGIFGNVRYGSKFNWNDSSMISQLGQMNDRYPKILAKEYFWSYLYTISPLINLNYNIENVKPNGEIKEWVMEYIPDFIQNRVFKYQKEQVLLPVSALNASTTYTRSYNTFGYIGLYIMYIIYILLMLFIIHINEKKNKQLLVVVLNCLCYCFLLTAFDNALTYTTTSLILIILALLPLFTNKKIIEKLKNIITLIKTKILKKS